MCNEVVNLSSKQSYFNQDKIDSGCKIRQGTVPSLRTVIVFS